MEDNRRDDGPSGVADVLARVLDGLEDGFFALDRSWRFLYINPRAAVSVGYEPAALVGRDVWETFPALRGTAIETTFRRAMDDRVPVATELRGELTGGWYRFAAAPSSDGITVLWTDIGDRRRTDEELRESDRRKSEFLAVLSHELRNPLAPIKNSLHILESSAPGGEQARRAQAVIRRQVDQMVRLVDDLLDVTRISRGKVELQRQRLDLAELVDQTVEDHRTLFEKADHRLRCERPKGPVLIDGDRHRLAQVVGNLLQNAVKFTPSGGRVTVALAADLAPRRAVLTVADTGVGMAKEVLADLFQPFMQVESTLARSMGGLGLGLSLVKGLVELHGGEVTADSAGLGRGATFTVRLPLAVSEPADATAKRAPAAARRRVLVIEDNIDAADSLREVLELDDHEVEVAYDGPEGIATARVFRPEIVLCDIGLPGMDGFEVARALRSEEALVGALLVALSGYALPEDSQRAHEAGFDRHLAKPPDLVSLQAIFAMPRTR